MKGKTKIQKIGCVNNHLDLKRKTDCLKKKEACRAGVCDIVKNDRH